MNKFLNNFDFRISYFIICILIISYLIKEFIKIKDIKILYIIAFQIMNFPLFEYHHLMFSLLPVIYYILLNGNHHNYLYYFTTVFITIASSIIIISNIFSYHTSSLPVLKYCRTYKGLDNYLLLYKKYLIEKKQDYDIYLFTNESYLLKIISNMEIGFTDILNEGNLGNNEDKYFKKIEDNCQKRNCLFILENNFFEPKIIGDQRKYEFKEFVLNNAEYYETLPNKDRVYIKSTN